jgi:lysozyme family protein
VDIEHLVAAAMERMGADVQKGALWRRLYWEEAGFAFVAEMTPDVAAALFDIAVDLGAAAAARMLQRALNALNREGKDHDDLRIDGIVGARTLSAVGDCRRVRGRAGEALLLRMIEALRGSLCVLLAAKRPAQQGPLYEWLLRDVGARAIVCT